MLRDRKDKGEADLRQQILCDSVELRNIVVATAVAGQRPADGIVSGVCTGLDERFGGENLRVNKEVSGESKSAGVNCRVDKEVLRVPFGIDRKDSGVSGCVVDEDISSANLIKEEIPTNEPRKEEENVENKKLIVAKRRRRRKLKHDATVDVYLNEKQQTKQSHEMDGSHVANTVDSTKEVS